MKSKFLIITLLALGLIAKAQVYKDSSAATHARVQDLLKRMTPEEKFWQLFMLAEEWQKDKSRYTQGAFGFEGGVSLNEGNTAGQMIKNSASTAAEMAKIINQTHEKFLKNTRLGIPMLPFDEALHGLVHPGATSFPQSIGLAATFDTDLVKRVAAAIANETKSRGIRMILSPVINIATDVRWGRVEETYGEDPFLSSEMGVAFISEFEKRNIIACPKHFIANVGDGGRDSYPIHANERYLREIHLPPFEAAFTKAGARSVMTSYNSLDGSPCTAHNWLLNDLLKKKWGFKGFVISDAGATGGANVLHFTAADYTQATEQAINNGLDVVFQTAFEHYTLFIDAFKNGKIPTAVIDSAVARVLQAKFELGLFDNPYADPQEAARVNGCAEHRALAQEAASKSFVLLKNQQQTLPLATTQSIALFGQDALEARLGGYSGPGNRVVNILEGLKAANAQVTYAQGSFRKLKTLTTVPSNCLFHANDGKLVPGVQGEYYANVDFSGSPTFSRIDANINFQWTLFSPDPAKLNYDFYSVRWTGKLKAPESGTYQLGIDGNDGYRLYLDGKLLIDNWTKLGKSVKTQAFTFEKDRMYDLKIEFYEPVGNAWFKLVWNIGIAQNESALMQEAFTLAQQADVLVVVAGIEEGEFNDRAYLSLPGNQEELIVKLSETGKPIVVLLVGGSAITMGRWIDKVASVVQLWYPGEAGGLAVADMLFGKSNPSGKLPITFPVFEGQLPLVYNHKPTGRGDDYTDLTGQPQFPFGYGLSYTQFAYADLRLAKKTMGTTETNSLSCTLTNTGKVYGEEVVQLYIRDLLSSVARPLTELKGFKRIGLKPGETKQIDFEISPELLQMLDKNLREVVEPGDFRLMLGSSSKDIRLSTTLKVQ